MAVVTVLSDSWLAQLVGGTKEYGNGTNGLIHVGPVPNGTSGQPDWKSRGVYSVDLTSVLTGMTVVSSAVFSAIVGGNGCMGSRGSTTRILLERMTTSFLNKVATGDCGLASGTTGGSSVWGISNSITTANRALVSASSAATGDQLDWTITAMCQALLDEGPDINGKYILYFRLIAATLDGSTYDEQTQARRISLYSVRDANSAHRPFVTITATSGSVAKSASDSFNFGESAASITQTGSGTVNVSDVFTFTDNRIFSGQAPTWSTVVEDANNSVGQLILPLPGQEALALLNAVSEDDILLQCRFKFDKIPDGGQAVYRLVGRAVSPTTRYQLSVNIDGQQSITLLLVKVVAGVTTTLRTYNNVATFVPGQYYWAKLLIQGTGPTNLSGKLWATIASEPNWQLGAQDSEATLQVAGSVGIGGRLTTGVTSAPITLNFDDFTGIPQ